MIKADASKCRGTCRGGWQTLNIYWRTVCTSSDSNSGHANVERVEAYHAMYQKNIEDLLNNGDFSDNTFADYVNAFPLEYRGDPAGAGENNISFADYLSRKINKIKTDTYTSGYDIKVS